MAAAARPEAEANDFLKKFFNKQRRRLSFDHLL